MAVSRRVRIGGSLACALAIAMAGAGFAWQRSTSNAMPPIRQMKSAPEPIDTTDALDVAPSSPRYRKEAFWVIRKALDDAGRALREGRAEQAVELLESEALPRSSGVIVERYRGARIDAPLSAEEWDDIGKSMFSLSYCIGKPGHRGIIMATVALPSPLDRAFPTASARESFHRARALSLMEPWIRVLQDVRNVAPVSERTLRFMKEAKDPSGWSSADVLAVFVDLDVPLPPGFSDDPRFPAWRRFAEWNANQQTNLALK